MTARVIIISGPPGVGKGVQSKMLVDKFNFIHVSTGDIFRDAVQKKTELGLLADSYIKRGQFVPDDVVINLVKSRLREPDAISRGVLLDGFPRTPTQAAVIATQFSIERFMIIQGPEDLCVERVLERRIDPVTNDIYNMKTMPPPTTDIKKRLVRRDYDLDEKIIRARVNTYYAQLSSILSYFRGKIQAVNGFASPEEVHAEFCYRIKEPVAIDNLPTSAHQLAVSPPIPPSTQSSPPPSSSQLCAVCMDKAAEYIVVPCGHQCGCENCLINSSGCPICRSDINMIVKVYKAGYDDDNISTATTSSTTTTTTSNTTNIPLPALVVPDDGGWGEDILYDSEYSRLDDISLSIKSMVDTNLAVVNISMPDVRVREPIDVCCVIDVSGSMGSLAEVEDTESGEMKTDGISMLDIVKHAVKAVIHMLTDQDRLSIVSFENHASIVFPLEGMTAAARHRAIAALETLDADGGTNIWGGLMGGMDALRNAGTTVNRKRTVLLLTDGQPSITPPQGHETELKRYMEKHAGFNFQLNTFGFGYGLDSELLLNLAVEGNGTFAFIPDAKIVGTCFINSIANCICTYSQKGTLHLITKNGAEFAGPVSGDLPSVDTSWGRVVELGPLLSGVSRDVVVPLKNIPESSSSSSRNSSYLEAIIVWRNADNTESRVSAMATQASRTTSTTCSPATLAAVARNDLVSTSITAIKDASSNKSQSANKSISAISGKIDSYSSQMKTRILSNKLAATASLSIATQHLSADEDVEDDIVLLSSLHEDLSGRMLKSLSTKARFERWGRHYLRAITRAHQIQQCTNFMDPGLQNYRGQQFIKISDEGGKIFITLPPPKPKSIYQPQQRQSSNSLQTIFNNSSSSSNRSVSPPSPVMQTYYGGGGGGCFSPLTSVFIINSEGKKVSTFIKDVRAGDKVSVASGEGVATVKCVIEIENGIKDLIALPGGLHITPRHPIRVGGIWIYPCELEKCNLERAQSSIVFNLVLDKCHILLANDIECVTWGHHLKDNEIIEHPFYGTNAVIDALSVLSGFDQGYVSVKHNLREERSVYSGIVSSSSSVLVPVFIPVIKT